MPMTLTEAVKYLLRLAHEHEDSLRLVHANVNRKVTTYLEEDVTSSGGSGESGSSILWAEVTVVEDANNYQCDIWNSRGSYYDGDAADFEDLFVIVPDIVDELAVGDSFPVIASSSLSTDSTLEVTGPFTTDAGTTDTIITEASHTFTVGQVFKLTSTGEVRRITAVDTNTFTLSAALAANPGTGAAYQIFEQVSYECIQQMGVVG